MVRIFTVNIYELRWRRGKEMLNRILVRNIHGGSRTRCGFGHGYYCCWGSGEAIRKELVQDRMYSERKITASFVDRYK
jgi:hypothetical protein